MRDIALLLIPAPFIYLVWWGRVTMRKSLVLFMARLRTVAPYKFNELRQKVQVTRGRRNRGIVVITYIHSGLYAELDDSGITQLGRKVSRLIVGTSLLSFVVFGYFYFLIIWHFQS
jgi:hypothetical protein